MLVLHAAYVICVLGLALYGFQALWLTGHYLRRPRTAEETFEAPAEWPSVAVHLPIYNEQHVAQRIVQAAARLNYPRDRLAVVVLDDSDDSTRTLIDRTVEEQRSQGCDVRVVRRPVRSGYKAGALAHALADEEADYIAVFDADFLPQTDFLVRTIPVLMASGNSHVGFVQTRWGHLNREYSFLTRSQAVALDGHFVVEQEGRQAAGFSFGFNGSGGVWRRSCIVDPVVGGWQADTLCEDLDLSYRAQLAGWKGIYLNEVESPAEIPPQLLAFKRQQFRWAKGSVQTLRKLLRRVWTSEWSVARRFAATLHLGAYLLHPLLLCLLLISLPLALIGANPAAPLALLGVTSLGPPLLYAIGQRRLYDRRWLRNMALLPLLMLLGTGLSLNNTIAAWQALFGKKVEFLRTPKFHSLNGAGDWRGSAYRVRLNPVVFAELFLSAYAFAVSWISGHQGNLWTAAFALVYALGFGLVAAYGLWQEWTARLTMRRSSSGLSLPRERTPDLWTTGATPES